MLVVTIGDWNTNNQFLHSFTYIILLGWIYAMTTWVKRMDNALRMFDSFAVVILQLVWTLYSIVQGGIYYREFEPYGDSAASESARADPKPGDLCEVCLARFSKFFKF